jgi:DNA-binding transcriptional MocR family regulator
VTAGTVARAYGEAERRRLVQGEVGRGTYVLERDGGALAGLATDAGRDGRLDLGLNHPPVHPGSIVERALAETLARFGVRGDLDLLLDIDAPRGSQRHREAVLPWVRRVLPEASADQLIVCSGAQHALTVALTALTEPGDRLGVEAYSYPGLMQVARKLHLELVPIAVDEYGLEPEALEAALAAGSLSALYCIPTMQNPTCAVMPPARRLEIAGIAQAHGLAVIEDDVYGPLTEQPLVPIAASLPELGYYVTNTSKSLAPGLRVGFLHAPRSRTAELESVVKENCWMVPPLMVEIVAGWISDGTAELILEQRRKEAAERQELAARILSGYPLQRHRNGFHAWLRLPDPWSANAFVAAAAGRGVQLAPTAAFDAWPSSSHDATLRQGYVRLCVGKESSVERLTEALDVLRDLLESNPPQPA